MNLAKQFREFGVLNSINPLPMDAQVLYYNLLQTFNASRWVRKLVVRTQTLENLCGMTRKRLAVSRNTLIQRGLIKYYPHKQASGSPSYELAYLYECEENPNGEMPSVFPQETHRGTQEGTQEGTQNGTQVETPFKTKPKKTKPNSSSSGEAPGDQKKDQGITPEKTKVSKEGITPHWQMLVDTWFNFYKEQFLIEPSFKGQEAKNLKSILERLEKHSLKAGFEWTEAKAKETFVQFIQAALGHSDWLSRNFVLGNIASQFDPIINPTKNGHSKTGKQPGAAKVTGSGLDEAFAKRYS